MPVLFRPSSQKGREDILDFLGTFRSGPSEGVCARHHLFAVMDDAIDLLIDRHCDGHRDLRIEIHDPSSMEVHVVTRPGGGLPRDASREDLARAFDTSARECFERASAIIVRALGVLETGDASRAPALREVMISTPPGADAVGAVRDRIEARLARGVLTHEDGCCPEEDAPFRDDLRALFGSVRAGWPEAAPFTLTIYDAGKGEDLILLPVGGAPGAPEMEAARSAIIRASAIISEPARASERLQAVIRSEHRARESLRVRENEKARIRAEIAETPWVTAGLPDDLASAIEAWVRDGTPFPTRVHGGMAERGRRFVRALHAAFGEGACADARTAFHGTGDDSLTATRSFADALRATATNRAHRADSDRMGDVS